MTFATASRALCGVVFLAASASASEYRTFTLDSGKPGPAVMVVATEGGAGACGVDALRQLQYRAPTRGTVVLVEAASEWSARKMCAGWERVESLEALAERHPEHHWLVLREAFDAWSYTEGAEGDQVEGDGAAAEAVFQALKSMPPLKGREWRKRDVAARHREITVTTNAKLNPAIGFRPAQSQREFRTAVRGLLKHLSMIEDWSEEPALFPPERSNRTRVAVYDDDGALSSTGHGPVWLRAVLSIQPDMIVELVGSEELRRGVLARADVMVLGGGRATPQTEALGEEGRAAIRDFVQAGGGFVGICAGACVASLPTKSWKHIGLLPVMIGATNASRTIPLAWNANPLGPAKVENADLSGGPRIIVPPESRELVTVWANFDGEIKNEGTGKTESLKDSPAVVSGICGKGRVLLFSTHCERRPTAAQFFTRGVRWCGGSPE